MNLYLLRSIQKYILFDLGCLISTSVGEWQRIVNLKLIKTVGREAMREGNIVLVNILNLFHRLK